MNAFALIGSTLTSTVRLAFFALGACVFAGLLFAGHGLWRVLPDPITNGPFVGARNPIGPVDFVAPGGLY